MRVRRRARWAASLLAPLAGVACNALLDHPDRQIDERGEFADARAPAKDAASDATIRFEDGAIIADSEVPKDATPTPITIPIGNANGDWKSPNDAVFTTSASGTTITAAPTAGHAVIIPTQDPAIPADTYTVDAIVRAPTNGEFGLIARIQPNGACAVLGSKFGTETRPFIGVMSPPEWAPTLDGLGPVYAFTANARYHLKLKVSGNQASGKLWDEAVAEPDPGTFPVNATLPWDTGRGVGYYIYNTFDAVLESMTVTVP